MAPLEASNEGNVEHVWLSRGRAPFAGKYEVERVLGQGGMSVVLDARHVRLGQRVAIKVLGSGLRDHPDHVQRFEREARAASSLTSLHAVRIFDIDATEDGTPFIVMELLSGRDLSSIVDLEGPQPVARVSRWIIEACDAISEAHALGIVHRDIKPANLFLSAEGGRSIVKVLDFGIAKRMSTNDAPLTHALVPIGTPHYMSPEQVRCAKNIDARTDVWSLGVTLYEMICGSPPFAHESSSACIAAIAADPVPDPRTLRPELDARVVAVIMKALAKNAADRYQSVTELVAALVPFAEPEESATSSRVPPAPSRSSIPIVLDLRPTTRATVSVTNMTRRHHLRSGLGVVSAAVLGFASLVVTPKCVSQGSGATVSSPAPITTELPRWPATAPTAPMATATVSAPDLAPPDPEPLPIMVPTPLAVARPIAPSRPLVAAPAPAMNRPTRPPETVRLAPREGVGRSPAHSPARQGGAVSLGGR